MIVVNSFEGGGAEKSMSILARNLVKRGFDIVLVSVNKGKSKDLDEGYLSISLGRNPNGGIIETFFVIFKFINLVIQKKPKFLILNCSLPEFIGAMFIGKIRYLVVEHSLVPWDGHEILGKIVRRFLRLRACKFICVNPDISVWPSATKPFVVIPNLIEVGSLIFDKNENRGKIQRLVYIGRLEPRFKRPQMFLDICEEINLPGLVIGHGEDSSKLMEIARTKDLEIWFLGFQENPWNFLRVGDLLVVPSATEGDGLVVAEAILLGIPVIVSDILAFKDFKLDEKSYCKSTQEFVEKITIYLDSIENFIPSPEIAKLLSSKRNLLSVLQSWEGLLL